MGEVNQMGALFIRLLDLEKAKALKDFQLGWVFRLILKMTFRGGRVPYDGNLWAMAGARSRQNWDAYSGPVIACFRVAEMGNAEKWLVHDELIRLISLKKLSVDATENKQLDLGQSTQMEPLGELFIKFYRIYPKAKQKRAARKEFDLAVKRFSKENACSQMDAAELILNKTQEFDAVIRSARIAKKAVPFPSAWLKGNGFKDPPTEWIAQCRTEKVFILPDWIPPEVWTAFKEMRKQKRQPLGDYAARLIVQKLISLRDAGNDPVKVLEQSIENAWQGVFPLKQVQVINGNGSYKSTQAKRAASNVEALVRSRLEPGV